VLKTFQKRTIEDFLKIDVAFKKSSYIAENRAKGNQKPLKPRVYCGF